MIELLAPAGDMEKFYTAMHFGADAVYLAGKEFGLRAFCDNFSLEELETACKYAHGLGKKVYVTVNIFASDSDFETLPSYLKSLEKIGVDAVIVSDPGVFAAVKKHTKLQIHISTQANVTNAEAVLFWASQGASRIVLARELSLKSITEIVEKAKAFGTARSGLQAGNSCEGGEAYSLYTTEPTSKRSPHQGHLLSVPELEVFCHGAMCVSMSGRCLLSNYLSNRDANRGECVQACRWEYNVSGQDEVKSKKEKVKSADGRLGGEYQIHEVARANELLTMQEDKRGTYILNSKDMNMLPYLKEFVSSGVVSLKIEGRMKSPYYVATIVNAYRRALDAVANNKKISAELLEEPYKTSHRKYTTGFFFGNEERQCYDTSKAVQNCEFMASVLGSGVGFITVEQRNRFKIGDTLQVVSPDGNFLKQIKIEKMFDEKNNEVTDAKLVKQVLRVPCKLQLQKYDILRK